jgi:phosphoenolpyruvate carboxylase
MINIGDIVCPYIDEVKPKHMRVFIARSDPALNYGYVSAFLSLEIALHKLHLIERQK